MLHMKIAVLVFVVSPLLLKQWLTICNHCGPDVTQHSANCQIFIFHRKKLPFNI